MPKWSVAFDSSFKAPLQKQCDILAALGTGSEMLNNLEQDKKFAVDNNDAYEGGLSNETLKQLRKVLIKCGPFNNDDELRSIFVDNRINPWRLFSPQTNNQQQRVDFLIEFLIDKNHKSLGNALVLFLAVLKDTIHEDDSCWGSLESLILQLQQEIQHSPLNNPKSSTLEENQIEYDFLEAQLKLEHEYESEKRKAVQTLDAIRLQQAKWEFDRKMDRAKKLRDFKLNQLNNN